MKSDDLSLETMRHSASHLLAAAVLELDPDTKFAIGPAIENGFYYDFEFKNPLAEEDLKTIEKKMIEIKNKKYAISDKHVSVKEAKDLFKNQPYKLELIADLEKEGEKEMGIYTLGNFVDLCRGPHLENTEKIGAFKLTSLAGAYWRGSEKNKMLTRIYGVAFKTKEELNEYLNMLEEAKKRDHKKIGKEMGLFTISDLVGKGLPMYLPKGNIIRTELENFIRHEKEKLGYSFVTIPHIARKELYIRSGHLGKYDAMMPIMTDENGEEFVLKAMNCPHHFEIYNAEPHTYKDLPFRIAENTVVYRNEKSGELSGLLRVKGLCQDDTHHCIRQDQIESEIEMILGLMQKVYTLFGFNDYKVEISIRDPKDKGKYFGDDSVWQKAEDILVAQVKKWGVPFTVEEGEAAFYGPKIDIRVKDSLGREWQLTTIQLDFNQPENFDMNYTGSDGKKHRVVVLHVAIFGSFERFMGILIEHYAGEFPLWLSPVQVKILPINDELVRYALEIKKELEEKDIRVEINDKAESLGKKIRNAEMEKVPYMIIVGEKEKEAKKISVRSKKEGDLGSVAIKQFIEKLVKEIEEKK